MERLDSTTPSEAGPSGLMEVPSNLPLKLDTLVGRDEELAAISAQLRAVRLVTLTGPPGVGKTRLALAVAIEHAERYAGGVWLVHLGRIDQPEFVIRAISSALSTHERHGLGPLESLGARIGTLPTLIVLDNCEHVVTACAEVASALLAACPRLTILATSQEPLAVPAEQSWPLRGLPVPAVKSTPGSSARSSPPVRLFADRARAKRPDFAITDEVLPAVVEICRRLDGIPLAIELAAARVVMFSPAEIARRLDDRFGFLTGGNRAVHPRHATLRAAVDWSYELLSEPERVLLRRLAVFAGSFPFDAVEEVCTGQGIRPDEALDLMTRLVARSMVTTESATTTEVRYCLLETIRHYCRDRLCEADETKAVRRHHAAWYSVLAERAEPELTGPGQETWLIRLDLEHDNLRSALHHSVSRRRGEAPDGEDETALRLAGALILFWRIRCHYTEGRSWLELALESAKAAPIRLKAKATWGRALLAAMVGDYATAAPAADVSLDLWKAIGDPEGIGRALLLVGTCGLYTQGVASSVPVLQQAVALARQVGDRWCLAHGLALCGSSYNQLGDVAAARPMLEECIGVAIEGGDRQCLAFGLDALGHVAFCEGRYDSAEALLGEALALARATGGAYETAGALTDLAQVTIGRGDHARARTTLDDALAIARSTNSVDATIYALEVLGRLAEAEGDHDAAEQVFSEGLALAKAASGTSAASLQGLGEVALARGDAESAELSLEQALALARGSGHQARKAGAVHALGTLARLRGEDVRAAGLYHEALGLRVQIGDLANVAVSLEALGGIDADGGRDERATRVLSAAEALRRRGGYARTVPASAVHTDIVSRLRRSLGDERFEVAWDEGSGLSVEEAVAYVSKGRGTRSGRPVVGWASLTPAEREVATLAGHGFTNVEIGEQLFVSVNTVKKHLARAFAKLGVSSRRELTRRVTSEATSG